MMFVYSHSTANYANQLRLHPAGIPHAVWISVVVEMKRDRCDAFN